MNKIKYPLMKNNLTRVDLDKVINHLKKKDPILTQHKNVAEFEHRWSKWLGVKYSVFVNSGSSANLLSMSVIREIYKEGEVIVPALTWISDIASVIHNGFKPVFVDIKLNNLSMNDEQVIKKINNKTKAVFITHAQGFNGLSDRLLNYLKKKSIPVIEDVCESHGAKFKRKKLGSYGLISNFSFYYAHHMTTIEGGMICTNNKKIYEMIRMYRGHGMVREMKDNNLRKTYQDQFKDLNPKFIFAYPGYNLRNNEIGAIIGKSQLKDLNRNIKNRNKNHEIFLKNINKKIYFTDFDLEGQSNYAFNIVLKNKNKIILKKLISAMDKAGIEYRRGSAGGGNQLRQPYIKKNYPKNYFKKFPITEHIHFYGFYIGNYPTLEKKKILKICNILNSIVK